MKKGEMTPTKLRLILSISLFAVAAIGVGLFYVANRQLTAVATDVSKSVSESTASRNNLQALESIKKELSSQEDVIDRANNIAANSQSYSYQNQIIGDLNTYADRAGIGITNIDFASASNATSSAGTATTPGATGGAAAAPGGLRTATISVTLKNPVSYTKLLNFFNMIEQSVPKLQISKVSLSKSTEANTSGVSSEVLSIEIYVR